MRVLIVEDDVKINATLKQALEEERYAVDVAHDGEQGEEMAFVNEYDVIVLDLMLPKRHGVDVIKELREHSVKTPILILTARDGVAARVEGLNIGADDYVVKPFHVDEVIARVRALVRRGSEVKSTRLQVADVSLDVASHTVKRGSEQVNLTQTEYAILEYMMHHPNKVVSRAELMEHVWDDSYEGFSNIVDVYMRRLRAKLDEGKDLRLVETVRGAGYRLRGQD
ncbi:MAG TPA: response regulator transcription factor [Chloroflexota bacterium]|nr:response regulator transcription factor [Chloroflexota bacterium]